MATPAAEEATARETSQASSPVASSPQQGPPLSVSASSGSVAETQASALSDRQVGHCDGHVDRVLDCPATGCRKVHIAAV